MYRAIHTWRRRPLAAHDHDAPPRLRAWFRWASLDFADPARVRADRLLAENLSQAQREQFEDRGYFLVTGGDTGKRYRIRRGYQMNVEELDRNGNRSHVLCFMPEGRLAMGDVTLAQKLALELFESEALKIANRIPHHLSRFSDWPP